MADAARDRARTPLRRHRRLGRAPPGRGARSHAGRAPHLSWSELCFGTAFLAAGSGNTRPERRAYVWVSQTAPRQGRYSSPARRLPLRPPRIARNPARRGKAEGTGQASTHPRERAARRRPRAARSPRPKAEQPERVRRAPPLWRPVVRALSPAGSGRRAGGSPQPLPPAEPQPGRGHHGQAPERPDH